ncbi:hypothetical protein V496_05545 [Pseudogymnoascus sp. VKM F-4515 (FW-2607)]|nr:hypothetical protein V496_05545 [Pseudogymnoascus sp. VKM F-4515 (FW-2607)]
MDRWLDGWDVDWYVSIRLGEHVGSTRAQKTTSRGGSAAFWQREPRLSRRDTTQSDIDSSAQPSPVYVHKTPRPRCPPPHHSERCVSRAPRWKGLDREINAAVTGDGRVESVMGDVAARIGNTEMWRKGSPCSFPNSLDACKRLLASLPHFTQLPQRRDE